MQPSYGAAPTMPSRHAIALFHPIVWIVLIVGIVLFVVLPVLGSLVLFSLLPPALYVVWIRHGERFRPEPWDALLRMFAWGAIVVIAIAFVVELPFLFAPSWVGTIVAAPFIEEALKGYGVWRQRLKLIREPEDGLAYGATSGLGYGASETIVYGVVNLLSGGPIAAATQVALRSIGTNLMHGSATSLTGYGVALNKLRGPRFSPLPWYLAAVAMHATFNALLLIPGDGQIVGVGVAVLFAMTAFALLRRRIRELDTQVGQPLAANPVAGQPPILPGPPARWLGFIASPPRPAAVVQGPSSPPQPRPAAAYPRTFCTSCGVRLPQGVAFCIKCGARLG